MQDCRMEPLNRYLALNKILTIAEKQLLLNSIISIKDKDDTANLCYYNKIYSALCTLYDHTPNDKSFDWNLIRTQEKNKRPSEKLTSFSINTKKNKRL